MAYAGPEGGCAGLLFEPFWLLPFDADIIGDFALPLPSELGLVAVGVVTGLEAPPPDDLDDPLGGFDNDLMGFLGEGTEGMVCSGAEYDRI